MIGIGLMKNKIDTIISYFEELFPDPKPQLEYDSDYSLLIAVVLSAQTTDVRVNEVTKILFNKYKSLEELSKADIKDIESIIRVLGTYTRKSRYVKEIATDLINKYDGVVPAGKAIIETGNVDLPEGVKNFTFVFNSTDGIQTIEKVSAEEAAKIFDLSGRRLTEMRRGVNIVNGKKIMVK